MRRNIVHPQADELIYEIRGVVQSAKKMQAAGLDITWENIGDPVAKGERVPDWLIGHMQEVVSDYKSWGYCPSAGMDETREFLTRMNNASGGVQVSPDDIFFYNGLADAVNKLYGYLDRDARVLAPSPCYPIHSSRERFHAGLNAEAVQYRMTPDSGWLPDLDEIRRKVKDNGNIAAIAIINPDNPTGAVWPEEAVRGVVEIAGEYGLFVIADEIYCRLTFNGRKSTLLSSVAGGVPAISLKGISKEYPWPGSRCGWMECYNTAGSPQFKRFVQCMFDAKMQEVCATTQPQMTIPRVMADRRYDGHLEERCRVYGQRSREFAEAFSGLDAVKAVRPDGAFYAPVAFDEGVLNERQSLEVENPEVRQILNEALQSRTSTPDKRLMLYLLAATGICVVPLSGFNTDVAGFRMTLLEQDDSKRAWTLKTLREKIEEYLVSA
ncbi:MAG: pyridoxal phosphate-dependent aminotransferase [Candidatus Glassbacteria bacterium]|nr:pyridoxal phosphate-dependent aminotransferase [Candidatus Glassbacteria bacterium]